MSQRASDQAPVRTCVGCGGKGPQDELLRFAAVDGVLKQDRRAPGRGVYTCRRLSCFERARAVRGFARVLRTFVKVEQGLEALYTER